MAAQDNREKQAKRFDKIVAELETAANHARITAQHFRNGEVPRASAHVFAMQGHLISASDLFEECARVHASFARTVI